MTCHGKEAVVGVDQYVNCVELHILNADYSDFTIMDLDLYLKAYLCSHVHALPCAACVKANAYAF